jgi:polyisoprenoid-binding protein YceI
VRLDEADLARSSVTLEFDAAKLRVTGKGEPAKDVPEAQSVMLGERVLDVKRFPTIAFKSRDVEVTRRTGDEATLLISGDLTLHGQTRPIKVAAQVMLGQGKVTSRGAFEIKQTAFGIKPVTAVGGTVRVKDELKISFVIVAMR